MEALRVWNEAGEAEMCPREADFPEIYQLLGDKQAQDDFRAVRQHHHHCRWLERDPNACMALPDDIEGTEPGQICPHNAYHHKAELFEHRAYISDALERLFRLMGEADNGLLREYELDSVTITELLASKNEINRQQSVRQEQERARLESERHSRD